jgi:hypothetical protein
MKHHVLCLMDTDNAAQEVIQRVTSAGSGKEDIFVLTADRPDSEGSADDLEKRPSASRQGRAVLPGIGPAVVGGAGHFLRAGRFIDAPGGADLGVEERDAAAFLEGLGLSEMAGREYQKKLAGGGTLIAVQVDDQMTAATVRKIFEEVHGEEISEV